MHLGHSAAFSLGLALTRRELGILTLERDVYDRDGGMALFVGGSAGIAIEGRVDETVGVWLLDKDGSMLLVSTGSGAIYMRGHARGWGSYTHRSGRCVCVYRYVRVPRPVERQGNALGCARSCFCTDTGVLSHRR